MMAATESIRRAPQRPGKNDSEGLNSGVCRAACSAKPPDAGRWRVAAGGQARSLLQSVSPWIRGRGHLALGQAHARLGASAILAMPRNTTAAALACGKVLIVNDGVSQNA